MINFINSCSIDTSPISAPPEPVVPLHQYKVSFTVHKSTYMLFTASSPERARELFTRRGHFDIEVTPSNIEITDVN